MTRPQHPSLQYAEVELGVHTAYAEAQKALASYKEASEEYITLIDQKRAAQQMHEDFEMDIVSEERAKHTDMSQAQMDKHLKVAFNKDGRLKAIREAIIECSHSIDVAEYSMKLSDLDSKTHVARMQELGGYLTYLAAVKTESIKSQKSPQSTEKK